MRPCFPALVCLAFWMCAPAGLAGLAEGLDEWDALFEPGGLAAASGGRSPTTTASTAREGGGDEFGEAAAPSWQTTSSELMQLTAEYVEFDRRNGRVILKGGAYATLGDMELEAEGMEVELGPGRVYAAGTVKFERPEDRIEGETLTYSYKLREGEMRKAVTWRGPNKVVAERLEISPAKLVGHELYTTACDHDPPHYRVQAAKGTLIPNDRLVLEHAALKVGKKRMLSLPRYKVSLRPGQGGSNFYVRPGYSSSRGFTLESGYDFYFSDSEYGRIVFNPTSRAGGSGGVAFRYGAGKENGGDLRAFRNVVRIRDGNPNTSAFLNQTSESYTWSHRHKLSERTQLTSNVNMTQADVGTLGVNEELLFSSAITHKVPGYRMGLDLARRVDLDKGGYTLDDTIPVLNQSPRFSWAKDEPVDLGGDFRLGLKGTVGKIEERLSGQLTSTEALKNELDLNLTGPAFRVGDTRFAWSINERLDWYSGASDRNFMSLNLNGTTPLDDGFELAYNYVLQRVNGRSPFANFDVLNDSNLASLFFRQRRGSRFHATWLQLTQDLDRGQFRSGATNLFWHSDRGARTPWSFGLNLGYGFPGEASLSDIELRTISTNTRVSRGDWRHQLITNYDAQRNRLTSFSTGSDVRIAEKWRAQISSNWGRGGTGALERTRLALAVTKDLHAWEARLRWDVVQKEAFLEFYLKHNSKKKIAVRADYDAGLGLRPQIGDRASRPGPILEDIPRP